MLDVRHYFSSLKQILPIVIVGLFLGACSSLGSDMVALTDVSSGAGQNYLAAEQQIVRPVAANPSAMTRFVDQAINADQKKPEKSKKPEIIPVRNTSLPRQPKSQWCRYLDNDAAARATILRAPTISGDLNDDGRKSATLAYDVMDIARARLIESTAEAKCRRYQANVALNLIVTITPNKLTRAGFAEKARVISSRTASLRAIKTLVQRDLKTGNIDRSQATSLLLAADAVVADGAMASSEAAKREGALAFDIKNVANLSARLFRAEKDLADINSSIRSTDAVSVNLEGGWREGVIQNGIRIQNNSMFGGVKVSVKLGAFNPARKRYEAQASAARLAALASEPGSIFWKVDVLITAHKRARTGLVSARNQLAGSRASAVGLKTSLPANDPVFLARRYKTEIEIIKLDAEIAAVKASINQLDKNLQKLARLRYQR